MLFKLCNQVIMVKFFELRRVHLVFAVLLFLSCHFLGYQLTQGSYTPFSVGPHVSALVFDETQLYLPGVTRFFREGTLPSEIDLYELREARNGYPILHSLILGTLSRLVGSVEIGWLLFKGLSVIFAWYLLHKLIFLMTSSRFYSICGPWVILLFCFSPRNSLLLGADAFIQPLEFSRTPHPALSFLILLFAIFSVFKYWGRGSCFWMVTSGITSGLLIYSYYFYWIPFYGCLIMLLLFEIIIGNFSDAKKVFQIVFLTAFAALPYVSRMISAMSGEAQKNLLERVGAFTHQINISYFFLALVWLIVLCFFCLGIVKKEQKMLPPPLLLVFIFLSILFVSSLGLNLQLITGYDAQHTHFFNRIIQPITGVLVFYVLSKVRGAATQKTLKSVVIAFTLILVILGGYRQWKVANQTFQEHFSSAPLYQLLLWARRNLPSDSVISSGDPAVALLIPAIAGTWNFVPVGDRTMATKDEILIRYILASKLEGLSQEEALERMRLRGPDDSKLWLHSIYVFFNNSFFEPNILTKIKERWDEVDPLVELRTRKLDFLLLPAKQNLSIEKSRMIVFENSAFRILKY